MRTCLGFQRPLATGIATLGLAFGLTTGAGAQTVAPENAPSAARGARFTATQGADIYATVCQGCHMPNGQGASGAGTYPALARNAKLASAPYIAHVVTNGQKGMPSFGALLSDEQVAQVSTYIRTHFGNQYEGTVSVTEVKAMRAK